MLLQEENTSHSMTANAGLIPLETFQARGACFNSVTEQLDGRHAQTDAGQNLFQGKLCQRMHELPFPFGGGCKSKSNRKNHGADDAGYCQGRRQSFPTETDTQEHAAGHNCKHHNSPGIRMIVVHETFLSFTAFQLNQSKYGTSDIADIDTYHRAGPQLRNRYTLDEYLDRWRHSNLQRNQDRHLPKLELW